jgi:hypothetical protein
VVNRGPDDLNGQLFLQLNLYAHARFPHHLTFVRNLLLAYTARETFNPAARDMLLRQHWFEDEGLANAFFATLSSANRLDAEIAGMRGVNGAANEANWRRLAKENPLAARFLAEADIWRSRFESATPVITALTIEFSGDVELSHRTGSLHRSLSYADARETDAAAQTVDRLYRYDPQLQDADHAWRDLRRPRLLRPRALVLGSSPDIEPQSAGYLVASVSWDYYQFDDALRIIARGRTRCRPRSMPMKPAPSTGRAPAPARDRRICRCAAQAARRLSRAAGCDAAKRLAHAPADRASAAWPTVMRRQRPPSRSGSRCSKRRGGVTTSSASC